MLPPLGQGILHGRPLPGCDGHFVELGAGALSEAGWVAGFVAGRGAVDPIAVMVCSEAAAEFGLACTAGAAAALVPVHVIWCIEGAGASTT